MTAKERSTKHRLEPSGPIVVTACKADRIRKLKAVPATKSGPRKRLVRFTSTEWAKKMSDKDHETILFRLHGR